MMLACCVIGTDLSVHVVGRAAYNAILHFSNETPRKQRHLQEIHVISENVYTIESIKKKFIELVISQLSITGASMWITVG